MTNCLRSNYHDSRAWSASDDRVYFSAESYGEYLNEGARRRFAEKYETYSQAVREERTAGSRDDSYNRNSPYSFHDHSDECVDSPLDLSRDSSVCNRELIINESIGVKSKRRLQLGGSHYADGETNFFDGAILSPLDLSKASISRAAEKIHNKRNRKPEVRYSVYRCVYCTYVTNHKNNMRKHMFGIHGAGNNVECPKCGKLSKHKYSLAVHMSYCGKEPRFHCAYCPYKSLKRDHLQRHVLKHVQISATIVTPKAEVYSPSPPPIQTADQSSPITPPIRKNTKEESEVKVIKECPCCGKVFRYWGVMQRHYKTCSGNCIRCKHCPYKTKDNATLLIHVNAVHPDTATEEELSILGVRVKTE